MIGSLPIKTMALESGERRPLGVGAGSLALLAALGPQVLIPIVDGVRVLGLVGVARPGRRVLLDQDRAGLRRLFNHARNAWAWAAPQRNPGSGLDLPAVDKRRERVVRNREWDKPPTRVNGHGNFYVIRGRGYPLLRDCVL